MSFHIPCKVYYKVYSADVWGHSQDECVDYDCPCVEETMRCQICDGLIAEGPNGVDEYVHMTDDGTAVEYLDGDATCDHEAQPELENGEPVVESVHVDECECGYEVNDWHSAGSIWIKTDESQVYDRGQATEHTLWSPSDKAIVAALVDGCELKTGVTVDLVDVDGETDGMLFINDAESDKPLFRLEYEGNNAGTYRVTVGKREVCADSRKKVAIAAYNEAVAAQKICDRASRQRVTVMYEDIALGSKPEVYLAHVPLLEGQANDSCIGPDALQQMRDKGGVWLAYANHDLGSREVGRLVFLPQVVGQEPSQRGPNWQYMLDGTVNLKTGLIKHMEKHD